MPFLEHSRKFNRSPLKILRRKLIRLRQQAVRQLRSCYCVNKDRQCTSYVTLRRVQVTIVAGGKEIIIKHSERIFVALVIQRARPMHRICVVFSDLSGSTVFLHVISSTARFSENKLRNVKCVFSSITFIVRLMHSVIQNLEFKIYVVKKFKRQNIKTLKITPTYFGSYVIHYQGVQSCA